MAAASGSRRLAPLKDCYRGLGLARKVTSLDIKTFRMTESGKAQRLMENRNHEEMIETKTSGRFEDLLMSLAIGFVNVPPKELELEIVRALRMTGEFTGVDRSYTFLYDFERQLTSNTHEWCREGTEPMIGLLQDVPLEGLDDWVDAHLQGETMHVPWVADLPPDSALRGILEPQGIKTLVTIPLVYDSKCLGFVGFDAVRQRKSWSPEELTLLRMLAELFTNAEIGRRRVEALEQARCQAESAERLLRRAVEAGKAAIWETDERSERVHCVFGWAGLLGEEIDHTWMPLADFYTRIHPGDRERVSAHVLAAAGAPGKALQVSFRIRHREQRWVPVLACGFFEFDGAGRLLRISGSTVDVTESLLDDEKARKRLELDSKLLVVSSRFVDIECYNSAVNSALAEVGQFSGACRAHLILLDRERQVINNTHEWCAPGVPSEIAASQNLHLTLIGDVLSKLEQGEVVHFPDTLRMDSSLDFVKLLWEQGILSMVLVPLMTGGRLEGFLGLECTTGPREWAAEDVTMLRNVSEILAGALFRNRAELAIRSSETLHRTILNSLREAVFMTDASGRITFVNQSWKSVTGLATGSAVGIKLSDMLGPVNQVDEELKLMILLAGGTVERYVVRVGASEREARWLSLQRLPLTDAAGVVQGTLGTIMDVSDQRSWEEGLIAAKIKAESANDAKTLYLSNLSHELRTPMHGVIGMLELMMEQRIPEEQLQAHAADARSSAIALLRLLDDILDIAKCERGLIKLEEKPVDLTAVTKGVAGMFAAESAKKAVSLHCQIDAGIPPVFLTDELRFRQILGNILKNAVTYTHSGSVSVRLLRLPEPTDLAREPGQQLIRLEVADTGIGIAAHELPGIFEPFVQLSDSAHKNGGSGLGLAIVHELVGLLAGRITIDSRQGEGTCVRVDLPLTPARHGAFPELAPAAARDFRGSFQGLRILVAEDNEISRIVAREHLETLGGEVRTVVNGLEAVAACEQGFYHIVLMDCLMPVMDGFQAAESILAASALSRRPVIVGCTANTSDKTTAMCFAAGMSAVISKPYTRIQLAHGLGPLLPDWSAEHPAAGGAGSEAPLVLSQVVFDPGVLRSFDAPMGRDDLISPRLIAIFRAESPRQVAATLAAIRLGDADGTRRAGHALKGCALSLGLNALAELCGHLSDSEADEGCDGEPRAGLLQLGERLGLEHAKAMEALALFHAEKS
jgi:PAS domain S-box-containing protein